MRRTRALGYSVVVAVAVFVALALPTLRSMFGPAVVLAVYAAVAVVAGGVTYATVPKLAAWLHRDVEQSGSSVADGAADDEADDGAGEADDEADDPLVEEEIERLREQA